MSNLKRRQIVTDPTTGKVSVVTTSGDSDATARPLTASNLGNTATWPAVIQRGGPVINIPVDVNGVAIPPVSLLQATFDEPTDITVSVVGLLGSTVAGTAFLEQIIPVAIITWGSGGLSFSRIIDCTAPNQGGSVAGNPSPGGPIASQLAAIGPSGKISIVASWVDVKVSVQTALLPVNPNLTPPGLVSSAVFGVFSGSVGIGVDPDFMHHTQHCNPSFVIQGSGGATELSNAGIASFLPCRLSSISAWDSNTTGGNFLMLFDTNALPVNGAIPKITWPLTATPGVLSVDVGQDTDLTFQLGCTWAVSSTAGTLTNVPGALARVDIFLQR